MLWDKKTPGIPDELFIRGEVPMTKSEIRTMTLSKLRLKENSDVLDIGCGTGSVTVECALIATEGKHVAIDQQEEAVLLTQKNLEAFGVTKVEVLFGSAPKDLPERKFDRIFLGGGSKAIVQIVAYASEHLREDGIFVANTILLESTYLLLKALEQQGFSEITCTQLNISKGNQKQKWMMTAHNPIYIISAAK